MPDLSTQLREYLDATASPIEVEEVIGDDLWVPARQTPPVRRTNARWTYGVAAVAAVLVIVVGLALLVPGGDGNDVADTTPPVGDDSPFQGVWVSADGDGSTLTMTLQVSDEGVVEIVVVDDYASVCSGAPSTMTGTGGLESENVLVIPTPVLTCDDGTEPQALSGPPLEEQLEDLTLTRHPVNDTLSDNLGAAWSREGAEDPSPPPTLSSAIWPQSNLEEIRQAQERADAGDPDFTWQLDTGLAQAAAGLDDPHDLTDGRVELVDRFLREVLGWEAYIYNPYEGNPVPLIDQRFLRCAPDRTNPLYPPQPGSDVRGGESCAPTIDGLTYESVSFDLVQPDRQGPAGIWIVSNWQPTTFAQVDPVVAEAQATERLEEFLAARIAGEGAEGFVDVYDDWPVVREVPLLYATTSGAPYERYEFERVSSPDWPYGGPTWPDGGYITFSVRLFAEGGATVVEQEIYSHWDGGRSAGIEGGLAMERHKTTENGQPVPVPYYFFDDQVVAWVPGPWWWINSFDENARFIDFSDPVTGDPVDRRQCVSGTGPIDAATLAQQVVGDPNFVTTAPVATTVGGLDAVMLDVSRAPGATFSCVRITDPYGVWIYALEPGLRQRLYLVDLPEGMTLQTLAVTVTAHESHFEEVIEGAQPIIDSIEFRPGR